MLTEQRRQQLDGIVKQMIANKETDDNINFVVKDFSTKYGNEQQAQQKKPYSGIGSSVSNFGKSIAQTVFLNTGGQKQIDKISQGYLENGNKLIDLAKKTTDIEKRKQLLQSAADNFKTGGKTTEEIMGTIRSNKEIAGDALGVLGWLTVAGTPALKGVSGL
jgi:hypothetical protein